MLIVSVYYIGNQRMAREGSNRHISIPKSFAEGNAREWFVRFDICCQANGWNDEMKALKLPTLLEGEALAVWLELSQEEQKNITTAKEKMIQKMAPSEFMSLEKFQKRKMLPGEAASLYLHELKLLLDQAMPELTAEAKQQLLVHQFLNGLPLSVSQQIRATGETKSLEQVVERAKLLMVVQEQTAAITSEETEVSKLREQVSQLTEQVAALNVQHKDGDKRCCFYCNQPGHTQRYCPNRRQERRCFTCGRPGHVARDCWQGNGKGTSARGSRRPPYQ